MLTRNVSPSNCDHLCMVLVYMQGARFDPSLDAENYALYCAYLIDSMAGANDITRFTHRRAVAPFKPVINLISLPLNTQQACG